MTQSARGRHFSSAPSESFVSRCAGPPPLLARAAQRDFGPHRQQALVLRALDERLQALDDLQLSDERQAILGQGR